MMGFASLYSSYNMLQDAQCNPPNAQIRIRIGIGTPSNHNNMYRPISLLLSGYRDSMRTGRRLFRGYRNGRTGAANCSVRSRSFMSTTVCIGADSS